ncbi:MAG: magnesium chelatase family protein [Frankiales bacterium]|nr:magnesium chelatase family protein [Frankiales bacterium]
MSLARTYAIALVGIDGRLVEVEADIGSGLPYMAIVGLPDAAVNEARDRVKAAITNSGEPWPQHRITIGLSPASLPKKGSSFDLALAAAILAASKAVPPETVAGCVFYGELGLDGRVRGVPGVLPAVLGASREGVRRVVVPRWNAAEARLVPDVEVVPVGSLRELVCLLRDEPVPEGLSGGDEPPLVEAADQRPVGDLAEVLGQAKGRRAVEVAAAGGHHLYFYGPPGTGKTMLAERLPALLPPLDRAAALEVTAVHSVAGVLPPGCPLLTTPPFKDVHHTATVVSLVGGGSGIPRPGAASLAHRGVLFLDEAPEFASGALDALRQPLESGRIVVSRAGGIACYPARFTLVLAANPCPCAAATGRGKGCTCSPAVMRRYQGKLSGPLLDRIDLQIQLEQLKRSEMLADRDLVEKSSIVAERVACARERTAARLVGTPWRTNAEVPIGALRRRWPLAPGALKPLDKRLNLGLLSARGLDRIVRTAWTIADLSGRDRPGAEEVAAAQYLRTGTA